MNIPSISVVLPVYNRAKLVSRSIESVLAQTHTDFELIIVDDASSDESVLVAKSYLVDERVRLLRNDRNIGAGASRNRGVEAARASTIAFQDSDDYWLPNKLAVQFAKMKENRASVAYCGAIYYGNRSSYYVPQGQFKKLSGDMSEMVTIGNPISTQTLLISADLFREAGGFDSSLKQYEDWELTIRLARLTQFTFIEEPLLIIYRTAGSLSDNILTDAISRETIVDKHASHFASYPAHLSRHLYIAGALRSRLGNHLEARRTLSRAMQITPSLKTATRWMAAVAASLLPRSS